MSAQYSFGLCFLIVNFIPYPPLIAQLEERKTVIALFYMELVILRSLVRSRVRGLFLYFVFFFYLAYGVVSI